MADHASAVKAHGQSIRRRLRNKGNKSLLRTAVKRFNFKVDQGKLEEAKTALPMLYSLVDKAVQKKVLSKNAADRNKSRLTRRLSLAVAKASKA